MKLKRYENDINESSSVIYFADKRPKISEENEKIEIIEKLSQHWNQKLKNDFIPRSLYNYTLVDLKKIEKFYLNESNEYCDFGCNYISQFVEEHPEYDKEEFFEYVADHNLADRDLSELQDIKKEEIERLAKEWNPTNESVQDLENEEYKKALNIAKENKTTWDNRTQQKIVDENYDPKLVESLHELRQQHLTNEAVEDIRIENGEIVFDVKCETDVQSVTEYNGIRLRFNHLCNINEHIKRIEEDEKSEEEIIEQARMIKEQCINEYLNELKDKLFESPDNISTLDPDNKKIIYSSYDSYKVAKPFAFTLKLTEKQKKMPEKRKLKPGNLNELWIGEFGEGHSNNCPFLNINGGDYSYADCFLGRLWFKTAERDDKPSYDLKVLSFWFDISKNTELLQHIVSEIEKTGLDLSDWYYDNGYKYVNVGNDSVRITDLIPLKELNIKFLSEEEKTGANIFRKPMKKRIPLMYRQAIYAENKTYNFEEFLNLKNKKE